jgi:16S rRNA processing protein RimM
MGRVTACYAIHGWIKVQPYTEYQDNLLDYAVWQLGKGESWRGYRLLEGRPHGQYLLAQLEGVGDREAAERLLGLDIAVARTELPAPAEGEYYWDQLIGLEVVSVTGADLGRVSGLLEAGSQDLLRVQGDRERLIPFTEPIVREVDLSVRRVVVDWEPDY